MIISWLREVRENACGLNPFCFSWRNPTTFLYRLENALFVLNLKFHIVRKFPFLNVDQTCTWCVTLRTAYNGIISATPLHTFLKFVLNMSAKSVKVTRFIPFKQEIIRGGYFSLAQGDQFYCIVKNASLTLKMILRG